MCILAFLFGIVQAYIRELLVSLMAVSSVEGCGCRLHVLHVGGTLLKAKQSTEGMLHAFLAYSVKAIGESEN